MGIAIRLAQNGGPNVLKAESIKEAKPGPGEVWIEQKAIGVNYIDLTQRNGTVPIPLPSGLGFEGAGRVTAIGPEVTNVAVGERVAYILGPIGSYASDRLYPAQLRWKAAGRPEQSCSNHDPSERWPAIQN